MASVWKLPLVLVIENNRYAFSTPWYEQYAAERLSILRRLAAEVEDTAVPAPQDVHERSPDGHCAGNDDEGGQGEPPRDQQHRGERGTASERGCR